MVYIFRLLDNGVLSWYPFHINGYDIMGLSEAETERELDKKIVKTEADSKNKLFYAWT